MSAKRLRAYEMLALSLAGAAFSGYLSAVKLFSATCALTAPCPLFVGYPACYFGFAMFGALAVLAFLFAVGRKVLSPIIWLAALGSAFALYFTYTELAALKLFLSTWALETVPSCALGLVVYLAILYLALRSR